MNILNDTFSFRNNQFSDGSINNGVHDLFSLDESTKFQSSTITAKIPPPVIAAPAVKETFVSGENMDDSIRELHDAYTYNMNRMMDECNKKFTTHSYEKYVSMFLLFILFILIIYIHSKVNYMNKLMKYTVIHQKNYNNLTPKFD